IVLSRSKTSRSAGSRCCAMATSSIALDAARGVRLAASTVSRAPRELKGFAKVALAAGETREVTIQIGRNDLSYWGTRVSRWVVEGGDYTVSVGSSSRDIRGTATVDVAGDDVHIPLTAESSIGEVMAHPVAGPI